MFTEKTAAFLLTATQTIYLTAQLQKWDGIIWHKMILPLYFLLIVYTPQGFTCYSHRTSAFIISMHSQLFILFEDKLVSEASLNFWIQGTFSTVPSGVTSGPQWDHIKRPKTQSLQNPLKILVQKVKDKLH